MDNFSNISWFFALTIIQDNINQIFKSYNVINLNQDLKKSPMFNLCVEI